jgi:hypothetical protein
MADKRPPDQRIVDGIREFYLGFLSKYLPHEAFDRVRSKVVTDTAMEMLRLTRAEIAADGVAPSHGGEHGSR